MHNKKNTLILLRLFLIFAAFFLAVEFGLHYWAHSKRGITLHAKVVAEVTLSEAEKETLKSFLEKNHKHENNHIHDSDFGQIIIVEWLENYEWTIGKHKSWKDKRTGGKVIFIVGQSSWCSPHYTEGREYILYPRYNKNRPIMRLSDLPARAQKVIAPYFPLVTDHRDYSIKYYIPACSRSGSIYRLWVDRISLELRKLFSLRKSFPTTYYSHGSH